MSEHPLLVSPPWFQVGFDLPTFVLWSKNVDDMKEEGAVDFVLGDPNVVGFVKTPGPVRLRAVAYKHAGSLKATTGFFQADIDKDSMQVKLRQITADDDELVTDYDVKWINLTVTSNSKWDRWCFMNYYHWERP